MALKAACAHCRKAFSAPEEYRGKKIDCPACGRRVLVQTEADLQALQSREKDLKRKREEDKDKIALIEKIDSRTRKPSGRPYYEEYQTGAQGVRNYNPRAPSKFARFRSLSDILVLCAYFELFLVAVGTGLMIYLKLTGFIPNLATLLSLIVIWLLTGSGLYFLFKFLGEFAYLLSDVGDQQNDIVQLLLDLRENTNRETSTTPEDTN